MLKTSKRPRRRISWQWEQELSWEDYWPVAQVRTNKVAPVRCDAKANETDYLIFQTHVQVTGLNLEPPQTGHLFGISPICV
jgi:hypothetical protein